MTEPRPNHFPTAGMAPWLVALDTGGTFTDLIARAPDGSMRRAKIPSDGSILASVGGVAGAAPVHAAEVVIGGCTPMPDGLLVGWSLDAPVGARVVSHRAGVVRFTEELVLAAGTQVRFVRTDGAIDAPRLGLHILTGTALDRPLPPMELRLSTTRGTNALLEGRGARVGVLVAEGLTGVVEIGDQTREDLFARVPRRTRRIAHAVRALADRAHADGTVEREATVEERATAAAELAADGCDAIVVSLPHALVHDREQRIADALRRSGCRAIAASDIARHPRLLTRTETACVHARIAPTLASFVADATRTAPDSRAFVFTSAGVLQRADRLLARDTLYSGPAGGARAVRDIARRHGISHAVGFDMGGTSADVSRIAHGEVALRAESRIDRMTVAAPSVAIDSVAAGGGSICRVRDGVREVGPDSAGAHPGPACYARGGPLAITDINLLAGRMSPTSGALRLDRQAAARALTSCVGPAPRADATDDQALAAFLDIADARMALAIESLCVRDGVDPRGHTLIAFGGAGGQHACAIADRLGIASIVFPRHAGFLCAQGVLTSEPARFATVTVLEPLEACAKRLPELRERATGIATAELAADGFMRPASISIRASLRLVGQESAIEVVFGTSDELRARFDTRFREIFGYAPPARAVEVVSIEACASAEGAMVAGDGPVAEGSGPATTPAIAISMLSEGMRSTGHMIERRSLRVGDIIDGPALVVDAGETVVIDRSWSAVLDDSGDMTARRTVPHAPRASAAEQELFAARLESIAVSMGNVLERTALSPNIRDRLDFSCAVLDANGTLVQNAPHLPVHLGALGVCTRAVIGALALRDGDIAVTNHPAFGGSHLPDVTTVAPVYAGGERVGFVAVRAHHAEIGGTRPGSFPPDARSLAEEGVVLAPFHAVTAGVLDAAGCRARFADAPFPSRNPDENLADLQAQIAATRYGVAQVAAMADELGGAFADRCEGELARADRAMRRAIRDLADAPRSEHRALDDGSAIAVRVEPDRATGRCRIAFAGSAATHARNFNAPLAVTRAATLYALRLLIDAPVPMNEGLLRSIDLEVPEGMLNPRFSADPLLCPPVVAGNVETSQSVVAALIACFGLAAESQSTMNNVLFGNSRFTIYETLGGGAGAGPGLDGANAVHVHMSNTRLTDIDVLERRAPVVIRRFEIRTGSGGTARARGGEGLVREYEFREPVALSFFGSRRSVAPRGVPPSARADGTCGAQAALVRGAWRQGLDSVLSLELEAGDRFRVDTPGGGGYDG